MSESKHHIDLVRVLVEWVNSTYSERAGFCLFCDCPAVVATEKPAPIFGHFPDVHAVTVPSGLTVVGEAKTVPDLETARSFDQLIAYLRYLKFSPEPTLALAVPWSYVRTAKSLIKQAQRITNADQVPFVVLHQIAITC